MGKMAVQIGALHDTGSAYAVRHRAMTANRRPGRPSKGPRRSKLVEIPVQVFDSLKGWSDETDVDANTLIVIALCHSMGLAVPAEYEADAQRVRPSAALAASLGSMEEREQTTLLLHALCKKLNVEVPASFGEVRRGAIAA